MAGNSLLFSSMRNSPYRLAIPLSSISSSFSLTQHVLLRKLILNFDSLPQWLTLLNYMKLQEPCSRSAALFPAPPTSYWKRWHWLWTWVIQTSNYLIQSTNDELLIDVLTSIQKSINHHFFSTFQHQSLWIVHDGFVIHQDNIIHTYKSLLKEQVIISAIQKSDPVLWGKYQIGYIFC